MAEKKKKGFDLAATLGNTPDVSKSDTQKGPLAFAYADIDSIHPDPYNAKVYTLSDLGGLMDAILLEGGLQQPLYVVPDGETWTLKSGHRRHAALTALVKGSDIQPPHPELRSVPIVYRPNSDAEDLTRIADGDLDDDKAKTLTRLMGELRVLIGNIGNRKQTDAELSAAAKELEDHYVALAELGVRFPGRLRDRVAEACNTSASKLARLKVIREKLVPDKFVRAWETGELPEQSAYALAQMPTMLQEAIAEAQGKKQFSTPGWRLETIKRIGMDHYLSTTVKCPSGDGCTNGKGFLRHDLDNSAYSGGNCKCCVTCAYVASCKYVCPEGKKIAAEKKAADKEAKAKREESEKLNEKRELAFGIGVAKRIMSACGGDYESFRALNEELDMDTSVPEYSDEYGLLDVIEALEKGEDVADYYCGYNLMEIGSLMALCRHLGISADYILGLADDPMTQMAGAAPAETAPVATGEKPKWMPGDKPPREYMTCYCKFVDPQGYGYTIEARWLAMEGRWEHSAAGEEITDKCLGWYPIPDDEEDEDDD